MKRFHAWKTFTASVDKRFRAFEGDTFSDIKRLRAWKTLTASVDKRFRAFEGDIASGAGKLHPSEGVIV